jgi:hypothetical protein
MFERNILARLFHIVSNYFSVDIISSSETEVSFTIDGKQIHNKDLNAMVDDIKKEFGLLDNSVSEFIEYKKNRALIFCVLDNNHNNI